MTQKSTDDKNNEPLWEFSGDFNVNLSQKIQHKISDKETPVLKSENYEIAYST